MKASDFLVKTLENEGVEYIFGIPGEENIDLLESIRNSSIKLILTRHEQAAGFMAATYGRLTGKPGVCISTLGPGATNLVTAAAHAQLGAFPMVMITGQKPIKKSKQAMFQIIDVVQMMKPITKFAKQIIDANVIPSVVREAFRVAAEEKPGAVHIELPEDIAGEEIDANIFDIHELYRPTADTTVVKQAAEIIKQAKHPLILIGASANRRETSVALREFIDKTEIPFFNTQMGKGVVPEDHTLFLGTAALSRDDYVHCAIDRADVIINVGHDVVEKPPFIMEVGRQKVIHINYFAAKIDDVYFPHIDMIGDIANSITKLTKYVTKQSHWDFGYFIRVKREIDDKINDKSSDDRFPILPQHFVHVIRDLMPDDGIVALDNGTYKIWFARNYKCYAPNTLLLDNALATMGAGLPTAFTAKLIDPSKKVIAVCGDGGFMMNSQELETAVREGVDLTVIILNDSAYGMIKWKQEGLGYKNFGLDFSNPDFEMYAKSYGAIGHKVTSSEDLVKTLEKCINSKGVHLVDVPVDYTENHKVLYEELATKSCLI